MKWQQNMITSNFIIIVILKNMISAFAVLLKNCCEETELDRKSVKNCWENELDRESVEICKESESDCESI